MAKKKRKYYSGKELLYRRQLERQQAEEEEKTNNIRVRQLHQINATINSYQIQGGIPHESIINYQS